MVKQGREGATHPRRCSRGKRLPTHDAAHEGPDNTAAHQALTMQTTHTHFEIGGRDNSISPDPKPATTTRERRSQPIRVNTPMLLPRSEKQNSTNVAKNGASSPS
ncbi:hypothetical protein FF1_039317 [Malus domestica]